MATDWKAEYLYKTFVSRTRRKSHECYIVNAIWQRLYMQGYEIEPVTQKYVRRSDGNGHKFALIDLFFPALDLAIEVDEAYHEKEINQKNDIERQKEILKILLKEKGVETSKIHKLMQLTANEVSPGNMPTFLRINSNTSYDEVEEQIDKIVSKIKDCIDNLENKESVRWLTPAEKRVQYHQKGAITIYDHIYFRSFNEICEVISPENKHKGNGQGYYSGCEAIKNDPEKRMLWYAKLATYNKNGNIKIPSKEGRKGEWINELIDTETLREWNTDPTKLSKSKPDDWLPRVTFLKVKTELGEKGYRFIGIFQRQPKNATDGARIYKRISSSYSWSTADV